MVPCPCCGFLTASQPGGFEICPVCYWEDDGQGDDDAHVVRNGANGRLSLTAARANYRSFGACDREFVRRVRKPRSDERPQ